MQRSTKIVATLGPSSSDPEVLERMFLAGVDVVRLNFSHGTAEDHLKRAAMVREVSRKVGRTVGIMADLQGPKIRVGKFKDGKITLNPGDAFILDADCEMGDQGRVGLDYKELPRDVKAGDMLLLDDGRIVFLVTAVKGNQVHCKVRHGGVLSNNKGINRQGGGLTAPALTAKDMEDVRTAAQLKADYLAVSFPKTSADMYMARQLLLAAGGIADGRGIAAARMLGADGVLLGTRLWASAESLAASGAVSAALKANGDDTARSSVFDVLRRKSWPAEFDFRALRNRLHREWESRINELRAAPDSARADYDAGVVAQDFERAHVTVGEAVGLLHDAPSAAVLIERITQQAEALMR